MSELSEAHKKEISDSALTAGVILGALVIILWIGCCVMIGWGIFTWTWLPVQRAVGLFIMSIPFAIISIKLIDP